ncbi:TIGR01777 family oxidoreductase [Lentimicrobium sp. S6]|uniref:TIGR01777 family oxidoreductase n=1 Tax=Lentimicrobium sp. S6 TaxID=2735872 RepID=UPI0015563ACE|nr:TIGR01777 family oxidoreductase [Lentimicrobium sp. S6]NPD45320.1 TIGR01777 family protein [Lentimicrobium sp. S6]
MKKNILISGGSGLVGQEIAALFQKQGHEIAILSRNPDKQTIRSFYWDVEDDKIDEEAIEFADVIIHLAGENISSKAWTPKQKEKIISSRTQSTQLLFDMVKKKSKKIDAFISASAIGYYGTFTSDKIFKEEDAAGDDFLAETVKLWETSVQQFTMLNIPTAILRIGVVMSEKGGALVKMLKPVEMGFGAALGSGKQWMPCIALNDLARLFYFVYEQKLQNQTPQNTLIYNAVVPSHISNKELMKSLAKAKKKPFFMPAVPSFVFKLIYGEMSSILLEGSRVSSDKIIGEGFNFQVTDIQELFSEN